MWLLDLLFGAKNFQFTSLPDELPPDGSVHFLDITHASQDFMLAGGLSENFKLYEFASNWAEQESETCSLTHEIMKRLCENRVVLTEMVSAAEDPLKDTEHFTVRFHQFFQKAHPQVSVYAESERKLNILTGGFPTDLLAYEDIDIVPPCRFEFFLFPGNAEPITAEQAWHMAQNKEYDLQLWLNDSPVGLDVVINSNTVTVESVQTVIKDVCKEHGVLFFNPPPA